MIAEKQNTEHPIVICVENKEIMLGSVDPPTRTDDTTNTYHSHKPSNPSQCNFHPEEEKQQEVEVEETSKTQ